MELLNLFSYSEVKTKEKNARAIKNVSPQIAYFRVKRQVNNPNLSLNPNRIGMDQDQDQLIVDPKEISGVEFRHRSKNRLELDRKRKGLEHAKLK